MLACVGLESSAVDGNGVGIDSFKPSRSNVQLSPKMALPAEAADQLTANRMARNIAAARTATAGWERR